VTRNTVAVIPVKTASQCKQRLSAVLEARVRRKLVEVMLDRVSSAVRGVDAITGLYIVTSDQSLVPEGARQIVDPGGGLNVALAAAAAHINGQGADTMLILPGDIPFVTSADVARLVEQAESDRMVVVSDVQRSGTNALLLSPPDLVAPRFGPGSLLAHLRAALEANVRSVVHECPNIARDIDEPRDVAWLLENSRDSGFDFLRSLPAALAG
jgi:2-phospho-L-lactate/phosphoenolpyruvate guanylyltransferase